ncbi:MAG: hypothetical protein M3N18_09730 [Actinomycetota bacterium]|nr:hypothetical protein [Actinomycetota bacterium]
MTPLELVEALAAKGVRLYVEEGALKYRGPKSALTPETLARLKAHKAEVIAHLRPAPEPPPVEPPKVTPEMVRQVLDDPPYWIAGSYLRSYREGRGTVEALAYAVTSALKIAGHDVSAYDDGDVDAVLEIMAGMGYGERSVEAATWA